ncbi:MAG: DUF86 domain-containing protein [Cyclobacteriaceae bacterium]|jgi:uncharacterized protein with HEPN domain
MSERSSSELFKTILKCIDEIYDFTKGMDFETFADDTKTKYAVLRALEIIGEAANRIPKEVRLRYEEVEWGKIIRSRNLIIHEYEIIDYSVVWKIVTVHLEPLKNSLNKILSEIE